MRARAPCADASHGVGRPMRTGDLRTMLGAAEARTGALGLFNLTRDTHRHRSTLLCMTAIAAHRCNHHWQPAYSQTRIV